MNKISFQCFSGAPLTASGWWTYQAGAAEYAEIQTARLRQLHDRLQGGGREDKETRHRSSDYKEKIKDTTGEIKTILS